MQNILGQMVIDRVPSVEMVRFVNSGTEACLSVLRLMRAFTGREKVSRPPPPCLLFAIESLAPTKRLDQVAAH